MADKYWSKVAELTGLQHCPKQGPFGNKAGAVIGNRNGYLIAIGQATTEDNKAAIKILVRYPTVTDPDQARQAIATSTGVAVAMETDAVKDKDLKKATFTTNSLIWTWIYSFRKPKEEKVVALANAFADALKGQVPGFEGKCEECKSGSVSEILLMNQIPVYYCGGCQAKTQSQQEEAGRQYEVMETNLPLGLLYGGAATVAGALAWGLVAYGLNRIFLWGAVLIGYLVAIAVIKGIGKINLMGQIAVFVLTVASVLMGDLLFYTLSVMKEQNVPFSMELLRSVAAIFWGVETSASGGLASLGIGLIGAGYAVYAKARKPKFAVVFEPLRPAGMM